MSTLLLRAKPVRRHGQAGEGVQQRDEDRHVGAADGQSTKIAKHERERQDDDEDGWLLVAVTR